MKKALLKVTVMLLCLAGVTPAMAQFNLKKAVGGAVKAAKAVTLTDEQMTEYVKEYIDWMDKHNQVCADDDPYTVRLKKLTEGLTEVEGMPLNFKVYYVIDVNAFACADGSVRVFSSLMDIMTDEELLGVIGHEVGHVAHKDSKNGFRTALLTSALKDGISSQGGKAAALTDSQLGLGPIQLYDRPGAAVCKEPGAERTGAGKSVSAAVRKAKRRAGQRRGRSGRRALQKPYPAVPVCRACRTLHGPHRAPTGKQHRDRAWRHRRRPAI